ncbi:DUF4168 domain-containing protein [Roseovarius atlanticus]|uniref:DUF4168 domain-containing protein n=1 Tax=Roseovarius atlanticus TaxID=1641875 RepID=UPI001C9636F8|nr:DUF4168 domain-containing protein [Roseovarius atlanticus]MBY5989626.1 DUF4168 domain-containing protein [Roseovarius atlanticus]MBY6126171.1 DUF4168 domain-containing protein [Roseovarius atlanticus]MBY6150665.1 DUF4168 domain-containing protein [Roseovarius atlanticus]
MISRIAIATAAALSLGTASIAQEATGTEESTDSQTTGSETTGTQNAETQQAAKEPPTKSLEKIEPAEGISNETLTDEKLSAFVQALAAINAVGQHFVPKIEAETDGEKRAELMAYANDSIVNAIEVIADITPAEFKAIDIAAQQDEELNQRILDEIKVAAAEGKAAQEAAEEEAEAGEGTEDGAESEAPQTE